MKKRRRKEDHGTTTSAFLEKRTAVSSTPAEDDELRGLAFTTRAEDVDPAQAAALMGHANDPFVIGKLRAVFDSPEGCVIGAFARVDGGDGADDGSGDGDDSGRRGGGNRGGRFSAMMAMGLDILGARDGNIQGKTLVGFAQAATDGAMVATVDLVIVGEASLTYV